MLTFNQVSVESRLTQINLHMTTSKVVHLIGENGAGKSTLLTVMAGLIANSQGTIHLNAKSIHDYLPIELAQFRTFLQQEQTSAFHLSVAELLRYYSDGSQLPDTLETALEIKQFFGRSLKNLSGGEQRRVHIARCLLGIWPAILSGKALILLDEPFQGLDYRHQGKLSRLLTEIKKLGNGIVMSVHDINLSAAYADEVWLMHQGKLLSTGSPKQVLEKSVLNDCWGTQLNTLTDQDGQDYFYNN